MSSYHFHTADTATMQWGGSSKPRLIYADTLYGTGKKMKGTLPEYTYSDNVSQSRDFTETLINQAWHWLEPGGSFFLQCDQHSNWLYRAMLEDVFGSEGFVSEIVWVYASGGRTNRGVMHKHDTIYWYAKPGGDITNNKDDIRIPYQSIKKGEKREGFHEDGKPISSAWTDIGILSTTAKERTGWPTQKPLKLMDRIVRLASNPGDIVVDPCCGSGGFVVAAYLAGRHGYGFDIAPEAIELAKQRPELRPAENPS